MPHFPQTLPELQNAGYVFVQTGPCKGCGRFVEWWKTPAGKMMPIDSTDGGAVVPHFATCPKAAQFRKRKVEP